MPHTKDGTIDRCTSVADLVTAHPCRAKVFELYGIDYACAGRQSLEQACSKAKQDLSSVLDDLLSCDADSNGNGERDWSLATISQLINNIETVHHAYLKRQLPRISAALDTVVAIHSSRHPELQQLRDTFNALKEESLLHMLKEEQVLFPMCKRLETHATGSHKISRSIHSPMAVMEHEHRQAGAALNSFRKLTDNYTTPKDGCSAYSNLMSALKALDHDLSMHMHKENNILFPMTRMTEVMAKASGKLNF